MSKVEERKQQIIGWYHSHPFFEALPSQIDIENHINYQKQFKKDNQEFIGCITSPYFKQKGVPKDVEDAKSKHFWSSTCFKTEKGSKPYKLNFKLLPESKIKQRILDELIELVSDYMQRFNHLNKIDLKEKSA